jgi:hypothetical protein
MHKVWQIKPHDQRPKIPAWKSQLQHHSNASEVALISLPRVAGVVYQHDGESLIIDGVKQEPRDK